MANYDVTINGAGLAGLQCARLLARKRLAGHRKNALDRKIHTIGIIGRGSFPDVEAMAAFRGSPQCRYE